MRDKIDTLFKYMYMSFSRRAFLKYLGAAAGLFMSGCKGSSGNNPPPAVNNPPVANNQSVTAGGPVSIVLTVSDVDGDALTYSIVTGPTLGALSGSPPNMTYTPAANYSGPDSFTFKANDGLHDSNTATISITVHAVNHAPVANDQSVVANGPIAIVLAASDVDGDALTYSIVTGPTHGALSGTPPNVTYTPAANYSGPDSFAFKANDGLVDSNTATVGINVQAWNNSRVVSVHDNTVTTWNGSDLWYGSDSFVDQARVDNMVKEGVLSLTGQATETAAWNQIIPTYSKGDKIAIKMNENNAGSGGNVIDPLPQLLKALVKGLKSRGIDESDIWFIEPSTIIDNRLAQPVKAAYPGVTFYGAYATTYSSACTYNSSDPSLTIVHGDPHISSSKLPDQVGSSKYFIHMPIMKAHGIAGVTLTYKNLIGLFQRPTIQKFHNYFFNTTNNPLVEIYANSNVGGKTVLIIGDGVYGNWVNNYTAPSRWSIFGNDWPKTVFFATDPVAIDCVMYDFLDWQSSRTAQHETYLIQAASADQGTWGHWNNSTEKKYSVIDLVQRDMG